MKKVKKIFNVEYDLNSEDFKSQKQDIISKKYQEKHEDNIVKVTTFCVPDKQLVISTTEENQSFMGAPNKMLGFRSLSDQSFLTMDDDMVKTYEITITADTKLPDYTTAISLAQAKADEMFEEDDSKMPLVTVIDYRWHHSPAIISASIFNEETEDKDGNKVFKPLIGKTDSAANVMAGDKEQGKVARNTLKELDNEELYGKCLALKGDAPLGSTVSVSISGSNGSPLAIYEVPDENGYDLEICNLFVGRWQLIITINIPEEDPIYNNIEVNVLPKTGSSNPFDNVISDRMEVKAKPFELVKFYSGEKLVGVSIAGEDGIAKIDLISNFEYDDIIAKTSESSYPAKKLDKSNLKYYPIVEEYKASYKSLSKIDFDSLDREEDEDGKEKPFIMGTTDKCSIIVITIEDGTVIGTTTSDRERHYKCFIDEDAFDIDNYNGEVFIKTSPRDMSIEECKDPEKEDLKDQWDKYDFNDLSVEDGEELRVLISFGIDVSNYDTSKIINMKNLCYYGQDKIQKISWNDAQKENFKMFNQDICSWDVSNVTRMSGMFKLCKNLNMDLSSWDVSNVTRMSGMFYGIDKNIDGKVIINNWKINKDSILGGIFSYLETPMDMSTWDLSEVPGKNLYYMFNGLRAEVIFGEHKVNDGFKVSLLFNNCPVEFQPDITKIDVSNVTDMKDMFYNKILYTFNQDISGWDVSNVTTMVNMFGLNKEFNQDISGWDVSNVTNMYQMFNSAHAFNQDISSWDVSNVTTMRSMFKNATNFNQDIGSWDVSNVTNMASMFKLCKNLNMDLSSWDVSNVTNMDYMFNLTNGEVNLNNWKIEHNVGMNYMFGNSGMLIDISTWELNDDINIPFNQSFINITNNIVVGNLTLPKNTSLYKMFYKVPNEFYPDVTNLDVSHVVNMASAFSSKKEFNQDISGWDVSNVTNMASMFNKAYAFNQDISGWDVSNVTSMDQMFVTATDFNQPLNSWDVSSVTNMNQLFYRATEFNQPLNSWDVSSVITMNNMFRYNDNFNQDISSWDTSKVTAMNYMFDNNKAFNQNISGWNLDSNPGHSHFNTDSVLEDSNCPSFE